MFWRVLHRHALLFAPLPLVSDHFAAHRQLIVSCTRTRFHQKVREGTEAHPYRPLIRGWLRKRLARRVSALRLRLLAREYLPGSKYRRHLRLPTDVRFASAPAI
jgi:hypothetical protein